MRLIIVRHAAPVDEGLTTEGLLGPQTSEGRTQSHPWTPPPPPPPVCPGREGLGVVYVTSRPGFVGNYGSYLNGKVSHGSSERAW